MYTRNKNWHFAGTAIEHAKYALIMLHGRGGSAEDILPLAEYLALKDTVVIAPEAINNSWYPFSFMVPDGQNQPALSDALATIEEVVDELKSYAISEEQIFFLGFSQGACLTLEYCSRHAQRYAGIVAFTGGLIGAKLDIENYKGDFKNTPVLLTSGDPDPHIPVSRVNESAVILQDLKAALTLKIFNGRAHTISQQEIELAIHTVFNWVSKKLKRNGGI